MEGHEQTESGQPVVAFYEWTLFMYGNLVNIQRRAPSFFPTAFMLLLVTMANAIAVMTPPLETFMVEGELMTPLRTERGWELHTLGCDGGHTGISIEEVATWPYVNAEGQHVPNPLLRYIE